MMAKSIVFFDGRNLEAVGRWGYHPLIITGIPAFFCVEPCYQKLPTGAGICPSMRWVHGEFIDNIWWIDGEYMVKCMVNDGGVWIVEPVTYGDQSWLCCLKRAGHDGFCTALSHFGLWNMWIYVDVSHDLVICREMYHHLTPFEEFRRALHDLMFDDFENLAWWVIVILAVNCHGFYMFL